MYISKHFDYPDSNLADLVFLDQEYIVHLELLDDAKGSDTNPVYPVPIGRIDLLRCYYGEVE